jgi:hypothetical protein
MLISRLDDPAVDLFIHFDKKVKAIPHLEVENSNLYILDDRIDVRWGTVSQIQCETALLEEAVKHGPYLYYHIISGVHLPLKPVDEIKAFFDSAGGSSVLTGLCQSTARQERLKVRSYNFFLRNYSSPNAVVRNVSQFLWKGCLAAQRVLGIERNRGKFFYKASNWVSLTDEAVRYILSRKKEIMDTFRWSFCGDEYFVPSELMASPLRGKIINDDRLLKREILSASASVFHLSDLPELEQSEYLFARKFTSE